ncbi:MAG TPA: hypothetical protein VFG69_08830 [Nannocystaceae bacterium]|nr:hypothetical protein [Nannocystaceae bacterium]
MISEGHKLTHAGTYLLKKLDVKPEDGGLVIPLALPRELDPLDPALEQLVLAGLVAMNKKKGIYELTKDGIDHIGTLIDEAESYVEEFDEQPADKVVAEVRRRRLDPMRVRFLWGWYQGEFDDLVLWQQRRGLAEIETDWASYLLGDAFWTELEQDLGAES